MEEIEGSQTYSGVPRPDHERQGNARGLFVRNTSASLDELRRSAAHYGGSVNNLIIAAGASALGEYNDETRVRVCWTYSGREEDWEKTLMGMTIEGIRYSAISSAFDDMSPGVSERMNIVYQNGPEVPENAPEGTDISAYFDKLDGTLSMFMIMIYEQGEDEPLNVLFLYNRSKYKEESVAQFAEIFHRKLAGFLIDQTV